MIVDILVSCKQMIAIVLASTDAAMSRVYYIFYPIILLTLWLTSMSLPASDFLLCLLIPPCRTCFVHPNDSCAITVGVVASKSLVANESNYLAPAVQASGQVVVLPYPLAGFPPFPCR